MSRDRQWARARRRVVLAAIATGALATALFIPQSAFAATSAPSSTASTASPAAKSELTFAEMTQYVYTATNQVRFDAGLNGLARDSRLDDVAAAWAYQQWVNGAMSHNPNYSTQIPAGWQRAGENVASGYTYNNVVPAWVASPGHYANLVNDYTSIGIGFYEANGKRYWSQVFAKYPGTSMPARPSAAGGTPSNLTPPTVSGTAAVGSTWTATTGTWTGAQSTVVYWLRCNRPISAAFTTVPAGCAAINGANGTTYTATAADAGRYLTVQVAAIGSAGYALAGAASTTVIPGGIPTNLTLPTVSGTGAVGATWTATTGTWTGSPTTVIYWLRCNQPINSGFTTVPAGCAAISGANGTTYTATAADAGKYLTVQVAASGTTGFALAGATSTAVIPGSTPTSVTPPTVSGTAAVGATWTATTGTWTGSPTTVIYWLRCNQAIGSAFTTVPAGCTAISGANGTTYTATAADAGKYLTVQVAAIGTTGFALAGATNTSVIPGGVPTNLTLPTVSGTGAVGATWTATTGTWTGSPTTVIYWLRCNQPISSGFTTVPASCTAISGANGTTYTATAADAGKYLTVQVAAIGTTGFALAGAVSTTAIGP